MAKPFEIALVMAGGTSGGAYTAGVLDFLVQAMDAWEAEKLRRPQDNLSHEVRLRAMSGASAGGMCAAIMAASLGHEIAPAADPERPPVGSANRFYDAWVDRIDIAKLLELRDVETHGKALSVLDSTCLEEIAMAALDGAGVRTLAWVDEALAVYLTVANLRGVPYGFDLLADGTQARHGMSLHMDHVAFTLVLPGAAPIGGSLALHPGEKPGGTWPLLVQAALASGAFPIGLRSRLLKRRVADYHARFGRPPDWRPSLDADSEYALQCVDGGLMDNEPLELARRHLSGGPGLRNERNGKDAHRAVLLVDPFPNESGYDPEWKPFDKLSEIALAMFGALRNQARFKPEELELAEDPKVFSRYLISPSRQNDEGKPASPAMTAQLLGGFGAFLSRAFRRHDFLIGRRNCQAFLRWHFCLPEINPLFAGRAVEVARRFHIRRRDGALETFRDAQSVERPMLPIVPLVGEAAIPVALPELPTRAAVDLAALARMAKRRLGAVGSSVIDDDLEPVANGAARLGLRLAWNHYLLPNLIEKATEKVRTELDRLPR